MNYKELEQKAEQALDKRLGTYGYMSYQDCHKHYKDGFIDGYLCVYNEYIRNKSNLEKANKVLLKVLSMLSNRAADNNFDKDMFSVLGDVKSYIEGYGES